ncbi:MAG: helix-turn-helix domain-containing protein [Flavobacterium sp.]
MTETILISFSKHEFKEFIKGTINEALNEQSTNTKNNSKTSELLNTEEAAAFLKIPKSSMDKLSSKREIPFIKPSKRNFYKVSDLQTWLDKQKKKSRYEIEHEAMQEIGKGGRRR